MQLDWKILRSGEQIMYRLRGLYEGYGYRRFKMSKFEEYDLYVRNKDFLVSDRIGGQIQDAKIHTQVMGSDHCPVELDLDI